LPPRTHPPYSNPTRQQQKNPTNNKPTPQNSYVVVKKGRGVLDDIRRLLETEFVDARTKRVQCGIIYCLSRADCEKVAAALQGVKPAGGRHALNVT
jgi:superfamily II DNA helicase RecQ